MRARDDYGPVRRLVYAFFWLLVNAFFRLWFRLRVKQRPRPFPRGGLVLAANHCSYIDPIVLALSVPRRVTYLVTSNVYSRPLYRPWMWLFGCIRVQDGSVNVDALRQAIAALKRGECVGIFPEGGISDDSRLKEGRIGVATLLLQGGVPVLTAGLIGTHDALPRNGGFPRPAKVEVVFSDLVTPAPADAGVPPRDARRRLRDQVMAAIARALPPAMQRAPLPIESV